MHLGPIEVHLKMPFAQNCDIFWKKLFFFLFFFCINSSVVCELNRSDGRNNAILGRGGL